MPALYFDLKSYHKILCKLDTCSIPAIKPFLANPLNKVISLYCIDVSEYLCNYVGEIDLCLINLYLNKVSKTVAELLKEERSNQYGFGIDKGSNDLITKNMTEEMLDDLRATHTKPVEKLYGKLDWELRKIGPQNFSKDSNDNYSSNLINNAYQWRSKVNRIKAQ